MTERPTSVFVVQGNDFVNGEACFLTEPEAEAFVAWRKETDPNRYGWAGYSSYHPGIRYRIYEIPLFERFSDFQRERG